LKKISWHLFHISMGFFSSRNERLVDFKRSDQCLQRSCSWPVEVGVLVEGFVESRKTLGQTLLHNLWMSSVGLEETFVASQEFEEPGDTLRVEVGVCHEQVVAVSGRNVDVFESGRQVSEEDAQVDSAREEGVDEGFDEVEQQRHDTVELLYVNFSNI